MANEMHAGDMRDSAKVARDAAEHFAARRKALDDILTQLNQGVVLAGGAGGDGDYQRALLKFADSWSRKFDEVFQDECKFVAFLDGLSDRIDAAAGIYDQNEGHLSGNFHGLSSSIDGGR
ncbi:MAG: hypothetical protein J2P17_20370 [Mycobacterium sp.]|nr:hypothetical protein [Mycobacterium sp.]